MKFNTFITIFSIAALLHAETCVLEYSQPFGYAGDVSGKRIYTKEEFFYTCTTENITQGSCVEYDNNVSYDINLSNDTNATTFYYTEDYSGTIGQTLSTINAYDKINALWSGWHGLCIKGADDGNWDWMTDPLVLTGYALTIIGASYASDTAAANEAANSAEQAAQAAQTAADNAKNTLDYVNASSEAMDAANQADIAKKALDAAQYAQTIADYAICSVNLGVDTASMIKNYLDDGEPCDPIDEICGADEENTDSTVYTITQDNYNDLMAGNTGNPDLSEYIEVVENIGNGLLRIRIINPGTDGGEQSVNEVDAKLQEIKEYMLELESLMLSLELASCLSGNGVTTNSSGASPTSKEALLKMGAQMGTKMAISAICPLAGLALDVATNVYDSLQSIDTCDKLSDATDKGSRHVATWHARQGNMCHFVNKKEKGNASLGTKQTRYRYCCYDSRMTKVLVEQIKAQFAKNWVHCSDINISELQNASFEACDPQMLDNGVDGTKLPYDATQTERLSAFQYTHHCIDTRELLDSLMESFGGDSMLLEKDDYKKILDDYMIKDDGIIH